MTLYAMLRNSLIVLLALLSFGIGRWSKVTTARAQDKLPANLQSVLDDATLIAKERDMAMQMAVDASTALNQCSHGEDFEKMRRTILKENAAMRKLVR